MSQSVLIGDMLTGSVSTPSATHLKPALIERALFCLDLPVFKQYRRVFSYLPEFAKLHKSMAIAIQLKNQKVGQYGKTERILNNSPLKWEGFL